jgi:hypothetical protein
MLALCSINQLTIATGSRRGGAIDSPLRNFSEESSFGYTAFVDDNTSRNSGSLTPALTPFVAAKPGSS